MREVQDQLFAAVSEALLPDILDVKLTAGDVSAAGKLQHEVLALEGRDFSRPAIGDGRSAHAPVFQFHFPDKEFIADRDFVGLNADGYDLCFLGSRSSRSRSGKAVEPDGDSQHKTLCG